MGKAKFNFNNNNRNRNYHNKARGGNSGHRLGRRRGCTGRRNGCGIFLGAVLALGIIVLIVYLALNS
ncbi:MAG: hypothetical protein FWD49_01095 [Firmicutes bacterium]|nr:hypothetical protein [Bacillota bacterium]